MRKKTNSKLVDISAIKNYASDVHKHVFWFKHYTDHGIGHSERVKKNLKKWMKNAKISLNALESSILTAAIYLHDIGMQCKDAKVIGRIKKCPFTKDQIKSFIKECGSGQCKPSAQNYIRDNHANLSKLMIEDQCTKIIPNRTIRDIIAAICTEHTKEMISGDLSKNRQCQGSKINVKKLAYLLRFGDSFDATRDRLPEYTHDLAPCILPEHELHMVKHYVVKKIELCKNIIIDGRIPKKWKIRGGSEFMDSLNEIVRFPIKNNIDKTQTLPNMWDTNIAPFVDVKPINFKLDNGQPWELSSDTVKEVNAEAFRIKSHNADIVKLLSIAEETLYIFGQNLYALADAKRDLKKKDKDHFKKEIFKKLENDHNFKVRILVLDLDKKNEVKFWHNRLFESNPDQKPDFIGDLKKARKRFLEWQIEARNKSLKLEIKVGDLVLDSANIIDEKNENGRIIYSTTVQDAICNPLGRRYEISRFGDIDYSKRRIKYETIYARAKNI